MIKYKIKETAKFEKAFNKLPNDIRQRFRKQFRKLEENPYSIGKPLGYKYIRELKNKGHRTYYIIYDKQVIILLVGVSNKKTQQEMISFIKNNLSLFSELIEKGEVL